MPRTSKGLTKWTVKNLPKQYKEAVQDDFKIKPWWRCVRCGEFAQFVCADCGHIRHQDRIRYCSRACQREDWQEHRKYCQKLVAKDLTLFKDVDPFEMEDFKWAMKCHVHGIRISWMLDNSWIIPCTMMRAFYTSKNVVFSKSCFHIELVPFDPDHPKSPMFCRSVEWRPMTNPEIAQEGKTWRTNGCKKEFDPSGKKYSAYYQIKIDGTEGKPRRIQLYPDDNGPSPFNAQWPWIFCHCIASGDESPDLITTRMDILGSEVGYALRKVPRIRRFAVKEPSNRVEITRESFDAWMELMYPVTSSIGNGLRPSCNIIAETYGHIK